MSEPQLKQLKMKGIPEKTRAQTEWGIKTGWLQKETLRMVTHTPGGSRVQCVDKNYTMNRRTFETMNYDNDFLYII